SMGVAYGIYEKPVGQALLFKGRFTGDPESWKITQASFDLGHAHSSVSIESSAVSASIMPSVGASGTSTSGQKIHIVANVAPFELSEFLPLITKLVAQGQEQGNSQKKNLSPKISGKASAQIDLTCPKQNYGACGGNVGIALENADLEGTLLGGVLLGSTKDLETTGSLLLKAKLNAVLDAGIFRTGSLQLNADATP